MNYSTPRLGTKRLYPLVPRSVHFLSRWVKPFSQTAYFLPVLCRPNTLCRVECLATLGKMCRKGVFLISPLCAIILVLRLQGASVFFSI